MSENTLGILFNRVSKVEIYCIEIIKGNGDKRYYIGQTKLTSEIRFRQHIYGDQLVDKKIRQYGLENTKLHVLAKNIESPEELDRLEVLYIKLFESFIGWNKGGYNLTLGGEGTRTVEIDREELQKAVDSGLSMTEMCKQFGNISISALTSWMRAYEIELKTLFQQHEQTIRRMVAEGAHIGQISVTTSIKSDLLSTELKKAGLKAARKPLVKTTPEMQEQIRTLTTEGKSSYEIERLTGINFMTVQNIQKKLGLKSTAKRGRGNGVTPELIQQIKALRAEGRSQYEISRTLGCSQMTVSRILNNKYSNIK